MRSNLAVFCALVSVAAAAPPRIPVLDLNWGYMPCDGKVCDEATDANGDGGCSFTEFQSCRMLGHSNARKHLDDFLIEINAYTHALREAIEARYGVERLVEEEDI